MVTRSEPTRTLSGILVRTKNSTTRRIHVNNKYMKALKYSTIVVILALSITSLLTGNLLPALAALPELLENWIVLRNLNL